MVNASLSVEKQSQIVIAGSTLVAELRSRLLKNDRGIRTRRMDLGRVGDVSQTSTRRTLAKQRLTYSMSHPWWCSLLNLSVHGRDTAMREERRSCQSVAKNFDTTRVERSKLFLTSTQMHPQTLSKETVCSFEAFLMSCDFRRVSGRKNGKSQNRQLTSRVQRDNRRVAVRQAMSEQHLQSEDSCMRRTD